MTTDHSIDSITNNTLYYQQDPRVPMTLMTIVFHGGGSQQEPEHLTGLARLSAKTLFRGTPAMTREAISKTFDLLGATVEAYSSETDFTISVSCFSKNLHQVLSLVTTILFSADFPQAELDLVKKYELSTLDAALQDPDHILSAANEFVLFDKSASGKPGSRSAIGRISRQDIQKFFSQVIGTKVVYFTAISDLRKETIEQELEPLTQKRSVAGFLLLPERAYTQSKAYRAEIVNSPGAANDRMFWSHRGIGATDDRRFDLNLVIDALGSFEGFLFDQLRNRQGWCYGAYAFLMQATTRPGRIAYYADPSSETSDKLIPEFLRLMRIFRDHEDFQTRLAGRNETFKNRYAYQLDIKKRLVNELYRDRYGIPILDKESYNKRIDQVNLSTAKKVIDEVFDVRNVTMVFHGDADRLTNILSGITPSVEVTVMEKEVLVE